MTRAEVLAEYLGMNDKTHPHLYRLIVGCPICKVVLCPCHGTVDTFLTLNMPDPLASGTAADAWLGPLVRTKDFWTIHAFTDGFGANVFREGWKSPFDGKATDPTPAIVRAMMAADPALREKMEGAEG